MIYHWIQNIEDNHYGSNPILVIRCALYRLSIQQSDYSGGLKNYSLQLCVYTRRNTFNRRDMRSIAPWACEVHNFASECETTSD